MSIINMEREILANYEFSPHGWNNKGHVIYTVYLKRGWRPIGEYTKQQLIAEYSNIHETYANNGS